MMRGQAMLKPVYALVGSDPFLQLESLRELIGQFPKGDEPQRADFDGDRAELAGVLDEVRCFSMFSTTKLVVVRDADDFVSKYREQLENFVGALADGKESVAGTLVFRMSSLPANQRIHKAISKAGEVIKCDPPKDRDVPAWIIRRCKIMHKAEIEPAAAAQLAELIGADLGRLDSELSKLAIQSDSGKITPAEVRSTVSFQREQEIKEITALLGRGNPREAVEKWRHLMQADPSAEYRAITWLGIWLEKARTALAMRDKGVPIGQMSRTLWINDPAELKDFVATAGRLGKPSLTRLLTRLTDLDRRVKSGLGSAAENIERFIATALEV